MKADHRTFAQALRASVAGLVLQLVLGVVLLIYAILGNDHTAFTGAAVVLCGIAVWTVLVVVFDQHRRERLEALEAESLDAAYRAQSSAFAEAADELRPHARRLAWMHKFLVPGVSLALGAGLITIGYLRFTSGSKLIGFDPTTSADLFAPAKPAHWGWAISIAISLAVVGFIFARYVSGMAKQKVWTNLRGGAAYAVAASLIGVTMLVGHFVNLAGSDVVLRYSQVAVPIVVGILGVEIFLTFLLNLYRPRKAGEMPRAAFDSPVLSFVASPDRIAKSIGEAISYQFGVDVRGSWAYQLLSRSVLSLAVFGGIVVWLLTTVSVVAPNEQGLRVRYGKMVERLQPGLYFKLPWPLESIETETTGVRDGGDGIPGVDLSIAPPGANVRAILWTNEHNTNEADFQMVVQPSRLGKAAGGSSDNLSLLIAEVPMVYRVIDAEKWDRFASPTSREDLIKGVAQRELTTLFATLTEDELLGARRAQASRMLQERITTALGSKGLDAGVEVIFVGVQGVHPEKNVATKFEEVVSAELQRVKLVQTAQADAIRSLATAAGDVDLARRIASEIQKLDGMSGGKAEDVAAQTAKVEQLIAQAGGDAARLLSEARARRWQRHMTARADADAYAGRLAAFNANPALYKANLYFNMLTDVFKNARVYLVPPGIPDLRTTLDVKDLNTGADVFASPGGAGSQ